MDRASDTSFREVQRGFEWWLMLIIIVPIGGVMLALLRDALRPHSPVAIAVAALFAAFLAFFFSITMTTEVRGDGIYVQFWPLIPRFRRYAFSDLVSAEARTYCPLLEYGGWGIRVRLGRRGSGAFNMHGNRGVQLVFRDGKELLLGSQQADELAAAIHRGMANG